VHAHDAPQHLHSFPTRRSSDLHILADIKDQIEGTILLIFQPGEEKLPGGGRLLCETGYLQEKGVDVIYGLHTNPNLGPGEIALRSEEHTSELQSRFDLVCRLLL